jgi:hypothetical protein
MKWCESMRRLFILKGVEPEECHRDCFITALTLEPAPEQNGFCLDGDSRRSCRVSKAGRRPEPVEQATMMTPIQAG